MVLHELVVAVVAALYVDSVLYQSDVVVVMPVALIVSGAVLIFLADAVVRA